MNIFCQNTAQPANAAAPVVGGAPANAAGRAAAVVPAIAAARVAAVDLVSEAATAAQAATVAEGAPEAAVADALLILRGDLTEDELLGCQCLVHSAVVEVVGVEAERQSVQMGTPSYLTCHLPRLFQMAVAAATHSDHH